MKSHEDLNLIKELFFEQIRELTKKTDRWKRMDKILKIMEIHEPENPTLEYGLYDSYANSE